MSRTFEVNVPRVTLPTFEIPWRDGAAIAHSLKSRLPNQKAKSTSKLPMLLGVVLVIVVLVVVAMGVKRMCRRSTSNESSVDIVAEPDATSAATESASASDEQ